MYQDEDNWPRHADGRRKMIGEMTPDEQRRQALAFVHKLETDFRLVREKDMARERGINVNQ